ncbi:MAG TPA: ABC transporter permease [Devosia sp.]|jgi:ABC-2 type transport system permease protein/lipopolysaccharide transport system permease protein|uniref:ABC transporter permease n=1 Tax=Devosia sp. TaxID=1871048 RepID=UPI002F92C729
MMRVQTSFQVIRADHVPRAAIADLWLGLKRADMWSRFAVHEIKQRFRRSVLGPFWLTASMGLFVGALGLISSTIFDQDMSHALPYIALGVIFWTLITSCISEGATAFLARESYIRNVPMPISVHQYQVIARNLVIWLFNMVIYLAVALYSGIGLSGQMLWFALAAPLLLANLTWMAFAAGIVSTRFRDIPQVIASIIQVIFFLTPIFWSVESMPNRPAFVLANPFYHLLEIVRAPLLGRSPAVESWLVTLALAAFGSAATLWLYRRAQPRIPYWV